MDGGGKGRELAAFPFCGPAKYLLLLQWGATFRVRIKGGPHVTKAGRSNKEQQVQNSPNWGLPFSGFCTTRL